MKKLLIIVLSILFIASIALNIRLIQALGEFEERETISMFKELQRNDAMLYHLQNGHIEKTEGMLKKHVQMLGLLYFTFIEDGRLSKKAIKELEENKIKYKHGT